MGGKAPIGPVKTPSVSGGSSSGVIDKMSTRAQMEADSRGQCELVTGGRERRVPHGPASDSGSLRSSRRRNGSGQGPRLSKTLGKSLARRLICGDDAGAESPWRVGHPGQDCANRSASTVRNAEGKCASSCQHGPAGGPFFASRGHFDATPLCPHPGRGSERHSLPISADASIADGGSRPWRNGLRSATSERDLLAPFVSAHNLFGGSRRLDGPHARISCMRLVCPLCLRFLRAYATCHRLESRHM
jgi:hypothetical protein